MGASEADERAPSGSPSDGAGSGSGAGIEDVTVFVDGHAHDGRAAVAGGLRAAVDLARRDGGWLWIEMHDPDPEDLRELGSVLRVGHPQTRRCLDEGVVPRLHRSVERFGSEVVATLHPVVYHDDTSSVTLGEMCLLAGDEFVVSIRRDDTRGAKDARRRLQGAPRLAGLGPRAGVYAILDDIVDDFGPVAVELERDVDDLDDRVLGAQHADVARAIYTLSRQVTRFLGAIVPIEEVVARTLRSIAEDGPVVPAAERTGSADTRSADRNTVALTEMFHDLRGHVTRIEDRVVGLRGTLSSALSLFSALASQRSAETGLVQSEQAKRISSWAAILAVPTIVSGIYGMNFASMPELDWRWGYLASWLLMVTLSVMLYVVFRKRHWL